MALLTGGPINYSGVDINLMIQEVFAETLFYKTFGARRVQSVKSQYFFWEVSTDVVLGTPECCVSTFNDGRLDQRSGSICGFQGALSMCYRDLEGTARELKLRQGMNNENILQDTELVDAIVFNMLSTISNQFDDIILNGVAVISPTPGVYLELCDGILEKFKNDATVIDVTAVAITSANVFAQLDRVIAAIPAKYKRNPKFTFKINAAINIIDAFEIAASAININLNVIQDGQKLQYRGYELVPSIYMPNNEMFATYADNIIMVYDSESDIATAEIYDKGAYSSCKEVEFVINFRAAVDYGKGDAVVYYWV